MSINEALRAIAGVAILVGVALTLYVDPRFVWFTVFVGVNLLQSAFTKWCPAMWFLKKLGLK
jgi:hypothetical protein